MENVNKLLEEVKVLEKDKTNCGERLDSSDWTITVLP